MTHERIGADDQDKVKEFSPRIKITAKGSNYEILPLTLVGRHPFANWT
jgi:hypothetical protein